MAKMEKFYGGLYKINLTASVGEKGVNLKNDVMVVQAMMKYALEGRPQFRRFRFSEPTGAMDKNTAELILEFQRDLRRRRYKVAVDGVMNRAVGEKTFGKKGFWTILHLNSEVLEWRLLSGGSGTEFEDLCRKFPQLHAVLDDLPVGSLELSLEPSMPRLGSLRLSLE
jgi:hypothetical protein